MNKLKLALAALGSAAVLAQTALTPIPIDWRHLVSWDDPNPPGAAVSWTIYASNSPSNVRIMQSRVIVNVDLQALLSGAPSGPYALFNTATSALGDTSPAGDLLYVKWPGGNGKIAPGKNGRVLK